jgi:hypothetical protein
MQYERGGSILECVVDEVIGVNELTVDGAEEDEGGELEEADLEGVRGTDFHGQGDIPVHGKGDGVLLLKRQLEPKHTIGHSTYQKLGGVGY